MKKILIYGIAITALMSCGENENKTTEISGVEEKTDQYAELNSQARNLFGVLPTIAENPDNPITDEKVELGKMLYFDNRLSKDNTQSCNTCHNLNTFGVDNKSFSEGNDGKLGGRNSPTTLNAAFHFVQFWDGREPNIEAQAGGPILNPVEMAMPSEKAVVQKLSKIKEYTKTFAKTFPNDNPALTYENLKKAIGAFERKLVTPSKFDTYIAGNDDALNNEEKEGLQAFINSGCIACHSGSLLGGTMYQKFGLYGDYWVLTKSAKIDNGRFDVTKNEADKYVFKVPSLRNIEKTAPYFHDGSVQDLKESIIIMGKTALNKDITEEDANKMIVFLKTLTGNLPNELKQ